MRGVVLAGGRGTRLAPLTHATNKHLLPVGREPMIFHAVRQMAGAGIHEVLVVSGPEDLGDLTRCLGDGRALGCDLTYRVQAAPGGVAQALGLARGFAAGGRLAVLLGDNIYETPIRPYAVRFRGQSEGARIVLKSVDDPRRYGVATLEGDRIVDIVEKPAQPPSPWAVTGLYFYDETVFEIIDGLAPSARGELEISDVNAAYVRRGALQHDVHCARWVDAGTFESLHEANAILSSSNGATRVPDEADEEAA